jgi:hypothetical protein
MRGPHRMDAAARGRPGDPAALARGRGDPAVERERQLEREQGPSAFDARKEARIGGPRFGGEDPGRDRNAVGFQDLVART